MRVHPIRMTLFKGFGQMLNDQRANDLHNLFFLVLCHKHLFLPENDELLMITDHLTDSGELTSANSIRHTQSYLQVSPLRVSLVSVENLVCC